MPRFNGKWLGLRVLVVLGSETVPRTHLGRLIGNYRIGARFAIVPQSERTTAAGQIPEI
jgi:hypothetical protein